MYLFFNDFKKQVQTDNLMQIIGQDMSVLNAAMMTAQEEAISYLSQKYDVGAEFTDTNPFDATKTYNANDRVYLTANAYSNTSAYQLNNLILWTDGNIYQCTTAIGSTGESFNPAHWKLLGASNTVYFVSLPYPAFNVKNIYLIGNQIFYKNNIYTTLLSTLGIDHDDLIQINSANIPPYINIFPDDPNQGAQYWGIGVPYNVLGSNFPVGWTVGDNRSQQMLTYLIDIALYHLHSRISPRNIPELRIGRYMGMPNEIKLGDEGAIFPTASALGWLQACMKGSMLPNLPLLQPPSGSRIKWNSSEKQINNY